MDFKSKDSGLAIRHGCGSVMLAVCFASSGTGALYKVDKIIKKQEDDLRIL